MGKEDDRFHKLVDDMLAYMSLAIVGRTAADSIKASYFDRAEPWTRDFIAMTYPISASARQEIDGASVRQSIQTLNRLAVPPTVARVAIDHAYVGGFSEASADNRYAYSLVRLRQITAKQARGRLEKSCQLNFLLARACVRKDGVIDRAVFNYAGFAQGRWVTESLALDNELNLEIKREVEKHAKICTLMQIDSEQAWRVSIGWDGMPRIMFRTDPIGVREVFRLRDIPNGKSRRTALRHWVTQHWRESSEGSRGEVRQHLRGALEFSWNGLRCRVEPSLADREENREAVQIVAPDQLEALLGQAIDERYQESADTVLPGSTHDLQSISQ